ncbi:glycoside hydrolase domain-containing protein [Microbacterium trichothecenolyticum]|uniref:Peptidoglycan hydrolase-like protein with peptidoglycan-binding domain n=1 Tax=Microbacterium trichothecenolyticum TaxID=69370 RepID=A0ABU0TZ73_MICTR|nr:glycoside hydrolase domain-containing protein [Microbacterium trichothecenolyticum]MDQ1124946.1 peptidoglycan hydrolase-like protein with peptidoglycan-binding domain [Microbacterium trichothecenolyticum]
MTDPWVENTQKWFNKTYGRSLGTALLDEDGVPGWATIFALTRALAKELNQITLSDNFTDNLYAAVSKYGPLTTSNPAPSASGSNIVRIAQGALYCKGYNADNGALSGLWNSTTQSAIRSLRTDMGLSSGTGELEAKVFKALLNMSATKLLAGGDSVIRSAQMAMNRRYLSRRDFYAVPTDGIFLRDTHQALLYSIQYEVGLGDGIANGYFGPTTKQRLSEQGNLKIGSTDSTKYFCRWFNLALRVNGYATSFVGSFTTTTSNFVKSFQSFAKLPVTGTANIQTWASLLVSTGDPDRVGTGADCVTTLTAAKLATLRNAGYTHFGRYLTNSPDQSLDKCIKSGELQRIYASGGRVFPLFQTGGGSLSHFTPRRGLECGEEAANAAWAYGLPNDTTIYFSVDFDALPYQVEDSVIPYFRALPERMSRTGRRYKVGVYGPRDVCRTIMEAGLASSAFVSDMSTGYAGNIGKPLPKNWAYDQVQTLTLGSGSSAIEFDKNIVSGFEPGINSISTTILTRPDPLIPQDKLKGMQEDWFTECIEHEDTLAQKVLMPENQTIIAVRVQTRDTFITKLATELNCPKALIMTPLIWEGMVIRVDDDAADLLVIAHYEAIERGATPPSWSNDDSSTGCCQVFARTAIRANNWLIEKKLITGTKYDAANWRDRWAVWKMLKGDEEQCIRFAAYTMIMEALTSPVAPASDQLRTMTPSQIMAMCTGYNNSWTDDGGLTDSSMIYGRNRLQLYLALQRWHQSFS